MNSYKPGGRNNLNVHQKDEWIFFNVMYTYNGILFELLKERNLALCDIMDELGDTMLSEIRQS